MSTATAPKKAPKKSASKPVASDRAKAESRLALYLVAPAVALMLLVTAFPMLRALYLSLFSYSLTAPDDREFVAWPTTGPP